MNLEKSKSLYAKSLKYTPLASQTLSKSASQFVQKVSPNFVTRGDGPYLFDVDGNKWIDYIAALGPIVLGYNNHEFNEALVEQISSGTIFSLSHSLEVDLSEKLCQLVPGVEKVRFGKNGSDVTTAAIRVARAATGKNKVLICGYHGWQDWYIATTDRNKGIPEKTKSLSLTFSYNNIEDFNKLVDENKGEVAAVIMESIGVNEPENNFLQEIRSICTREGIVLIFDEIVNGFRLAPGGGGEYYSVTPDLITMGKAMGNGIPISAIGGKDEIMKEFEDVFFSFTFGGDTLGIKAALTTIEIMEREDGYKKLFKKGEKLKSSISESIIRYGLEEHMICKGLPHHTVIEFSEKKVSSILKKSLLQQECHKKGLLFLGVHFTTLAHTDELIDETAQIYDKCIKTLGEYLDKEQPIDFLIDKEIQPVFRKRV